MIAMDTVDKLLKLTATITTFAVLAAVAGNFLKTHAHNPESKVYKSPVATATMLGFLLICYLLIHYKMGVLPTLSGAGYLTIKVTGAILMIAGASVNIKGRMDLGGNWADQATIYNDQSLVTDGAFRFVRHPLYSSLIWMFIGAALLHMNYLVLILTVVVFIPAMYFRANIEEIMLVQIFPEYSRYQQKTGMLFPRISNKFCFMKRVITYCQGLPAGGSSPLWKDRTFKINKRLR